MTTKADMALIALLRENARASTATLARRLGVSRTTVQSRIDRLEKRGIITGYTVKLSSEHESHLVRAHVLVTALPKFSPKVEIGLKTMMAVRSVHSISGNFDMIVIVEAPSIGELDSVLDQIGALEGVERTMSSIILSTRIER
ncbi:Lrp/AsnC family transcriptional regulator [Pseudochrobactrum kiredjianiae]|uniref:Lrp/AsnC family transcriptional regulator n=1 Tax=Pseudochrobactrum kiredjianiae TaxID=386305 RepID=A0ABW3V3M9_9HYPH|nr:Lrp/AsnC family transcriptional regulator [Pseudochrobactrum kiredjianiae]MDM7850709.1 Lrp/AsnC family transcriptional regulator [Pseudochrobactrum kiredjianiae]